MQDFKFEYAEYGDIPLELFWRGMISLTLTCLNILCIVMVGTLMLLLKQVGTRYTELDTELSEQYIVHNYTNYTYTYVIQLQHSKQNTEDAEELVGTRQPSFQALAPMFD